MGCLVNGAIRKALTLNPALHQRNSPLILGLVDPLEYASIRSGDSGWSQTLHQHKILGQLGMGGMGKVHLADRIHTAMSSESSCHTCTRRGSR